MEKSLTEIPISESLPRFLCAVPKEQTQQRTFFNVVKDDLYKELVDIPYSGIHHYAFGKSGVWQITDGPSGRAIYRKNGLKLDELENDYEGKFWYKFPKIPMSILLEWLAVTYYFAEKGMEVTGNIYYDKKEKEYYLDIPEQIITSCTFTSEYTEDLERDKNKVCVIEIHSHHGMNAFYSGQDDDNAKSTRLNFVTGNIGQKTFGGDPTFVARYGIYSMNIPVLLSDVFDIPDEDIKYWDSNKLSGQTMTIPSLSSRTLPQIDEQKIKNVSTGAKKGFYTSDIFDGWSDEQKNYELEMRKRTYHLPQQEDNEFTFMEEFRSKIAHFTYGGLAGLLETLSCQIANFFIEDGIEDQSVGEFITEDINPMNDLLTGLEENITDKSSEGFFPKDIVVLNPFTYEVINSFCSYMPEDYRSCLDTAKLSAASVVGAEIIISNGII